MTKFILKWLQSKNVKDMIGKPNSVLELGSLNMNGSPRQAINAKEYVGVDMQAGKGVDVVANAHDLDLEKQFDVVVCCEMLEHDDNPLKTIEVAKQHLAPGGLLIVTTPTRLTKNHKGPKDYWRLMPDAMKQLVFAGMENVTFQTIRKRTHCCIGRKPLG